MDFDRSGFDREVGLRLQRARRDRGVTQEELAKRIGLPRPSYANIESGRQRIPLDVVWRAAIVLSVPVGSLVPEPLGRRGETAPLVPIDLSAIPTLPGIAPAGEALSFATRPKPPGNRQR